MSKLKYLVFILLFITTAAYAVPKEIDWDDLIPWTAVFSPGEVKFNKSLVDKEIKIPGYVLPLDTFGRGVNSFLLVPYIGACIHVPPPAPNQLVYVEAENPWEGLAWWEPVYVTGKMKIETQNIEDLAIVGYEMAASKIEYYRGETGVHGFC